MSKHQVEYDNDGLSKNDPWSLDEYLSEDNFSPKESELIKESVQSWLREYYTAGVDLIEALAELGPIEE